MPCRLGVYPNPGLELHLSTPVLGWICEKKVSATVTQQDPAERTMPCCTKSGGTAGGSKAPLQKPL